MSAVAVAHLLTIAGAGTLLFAFADSTWAAPVNTALFIVLAIVNGYTARRTRRHDRELVDVKRKVGADRRSSDPHRDQEPAA